MAWSEELTGHILEIDDGALDGQRPGGNVDGPKSAGGPGVPDDDDTGVDTRDGSGSGHWKHVPRRERSVLVHSRFQLAIDGSEGVSSGVTDGGTGRKSPTVDSLVPSGIDALVRDALDGARVSSMEVMYTRGNVGLYRMPSWYVQRGPGLVVRVRGADGDGSTALGGVDGDGGGWRDVLVAVGRMIGSSSGSIVDRKSYVVGQGGREMSEAREANHWSVSETGNASFAGVFQGWLTQDFPCIESIQRWMRLLPCGGQAGVSEVMQKLRMLELPYHSIRIVVDGGHSGRMLTVELSGILHEDVDEGGVEMMSSRNSRMNRERTGLGRASGEDGIVQGLFDGKRECPVVERSDFRKCDEEECGGALQVAVSSYLLQRRGEEGNPLLGTLESVVRVEDDGRDSAKGRGKKAHIVYRQALPWEVIVDASSLAVQGREMVPGGMNVTGVSWTGARGREHGGLLEVDIDLDLERWMTKQGKIDKSFSVGLNVERPILSVFDYPADMSRGVDIPAPELVLTVCGNSPASGACASRNVIRAAGQNLLVQLPIPDASMPFNVACFTATLLSLLFGASMPVLLWDKEQLKKVQSEKKSLKARLKRMVIALVIGGVALMYLDLSTRAAVNDALGPIMKRLGVEFSM